MIRPIITALIEYGLAIYVLKRGKSHKRLIASIIFLLATYQLGEVLVFATNGEQYAFKIAYAATTLLPPLGVLLVSKIIKKQLGYIFFQSAAIGFVAYILFTTTLVNVFELGQFCIRVYKYDDLFANSWFYYYQGTLLYTMGTMIYGLITIRTKEIRTKLKFVLAAYISFDLVTIVIGYVNPWFWPSAASLMCALAVVTAFILTKMSVGTSMERPGGRVFVRKKRKL